VRGPLRDAPLALADASSLAPDDFVARLDYTSELAENNPDWKLDLNDDVETITLLAEAKEEGVTFVAGPDFMLEGGDSSLRLSFAPVPADQVAEGVKRLARALERARGASGQRAA